MLRVRLARRLAMSRRARGAPWGYALLAYLDARKVDGFVAKPSPVLISNHIANHLYMLGNGRWVPFSVRYGAADRAVAEVEAWLNRPAVDGGDTVGEGER